MCERFRVIWLSSLLAGCHFYNQGKDNLAQQVQKSFQDLRISQVVDEEKKLSNDMLKAELDTARSYDSTVRDNRIALLLEVPVAVTAAQALCTDAQKSQGARGTFLCEVDTQIVRVAGPDPNKLAVALSQITLLDQITMQNADQWLRRMNGAERKAVEQLECTEENLARLRGFDPTRAAEFANEKWKAAFALFLKGYVTAGTGECSQLLDVEKMIASAADGDLGKAHADLRAARDALAQAKAAATTISNEYDEAQKKYDDAKNAKKGVQHAEDELNAVRKKLDGYLDQTEDLTKDVTKALNGVNLVGNPAQVASLVTKVKAITDSVRALMKDASSTYDSSGAAALVDTANKLQGIERDRTLPALLLQAQALDGQLQGARAAAAQAETQIAALQDRASALERAFQELWQAKKALVSVPSTVKTTPASSTPTASATGGAPTALIPKQIACSVEEQGRAVGEVIVDSTCKRAVATAILHYANAWTIGLVAAREAQLRYVGAIDAGALDETAAALGAWEHVLAIPISQVAAFHAGGVKPEELARIIVEALGFAGLTAATAAK